MFSLARNDEIGAYLGERIYLQYQSDRDFCRKWIEAEGGMIDDVELGRKANKLCQIKSGRKSIQIYDLPIFSGLLDITCEEILSAGNCAVENHNRLTNYKVACSQDESLWEQYLQREDKIFLCSDEYDKTVIDYALEYKNYKFLKYLMDRGHIAFVCEGPFGYYKSFGAKTDIERKPAWKDQNLEQKVRNNDSFRRRLISLAIENNDNSVLAKLKAREIPDLYHADHMSVVMPNCGEYYDEKMLKRIASLDESALDYFWEHFKIQTWCKKSYTFLFPYIDTLVEMMIENGHSCCDMALEKCYEHNLGVREQLQKMSAADCEAGCDGFF